MCACVCVCVREDISRTTRAIFTYLFRECCLRSWLGLLRQGYEISREGTVLGVFFPIDNALYSRAFGTPTKTAEPIKMPFGLISGLSPRNSVLRGVTIPEGEGAILGKHVPDKPNTPMNCELTGPCSGVHTIETDA